MLSKRLKQRFLPSMRPAIVVASYGRSGSTLVQGALAYAMSVARFGRSRGVVNDMSWNLAERPPLRGTVCKTHDLPHALANRRDVKALFVFATPSDAVRSVLHQFEREGPRWGRHHLLHLRATGPIEDVTTRDILGIGEQLDAWTAFTGCPVLCVRYEALWAGIERIRAFTGLPVELPERRARRDTPLSPAIEADIAATYGALDARVAALPDVFEP